MCMRNITKPKNDATEFITSSMPFVSSFVFSVNPFQ